MSKLECLIGLINTIPLNNIKTSLPLELLHHFKYLTIASVNKDLMYLTTPSGHPFDACFVDKQGETIISTFEFKCVENEKFLGPKMLKELELDYSSVDFIDLGFLKKESFNRQLDFLTNEYVPLAKKPAIQVTDFSSSIIENACTPLFEKNVIEIFNDYNSLTGKLQMLTEKLLV